MDQDKTEILHGSSNFVRTDTVNDSRKKAAAVSGLNEKLNPGDNIMTGVATRAVAEMAASSKSIAPILNSVNKELKTIHNEVLPIKGIFKLLQKMEKSLVNTDKKKKTDTKSEINEKGLDQLTKNSQKTVTIADNIAQNTAYLAHATEQYLDTTRSISEKIDWIGRMLQTKFESKEKDRSHSISYMEDKRNKHLAHTFADAIDNSGMAKSMEKGFKKISARQALFSLSNLGQGGGKAFLDGLVNAIGSGILLAFKNPVVLSVLAGIGIGRVVTDAINKSVEKERELNLKVLKRSNQERIEENAEDEAEYKALVEYNKKRGKETHITAVERKKAKNQIRVYKKFEDSIALSRQREEEYYKKHPKMALSKTSAGTSTNWGFHLTPEERKNLAKDAYSLGLISFNAKEQEEYDRRVQKQTEGKATNWDNTFKSPKRMLEDKARTLFYDIDLGRQISSGVETKDLIGHDVNGRSYRGNNIPESTITRSNKTFSKMSGAQDILDRNTPLLQDAGSSNINWNGKKQGLKPDIIEKIDKLGELYSSPLEVTDGLRDEARIKSMYNDYCKLYGQPSEDNDKHWRWDKGNDDTQTLNKPGKSPHQYGVAVDLKIPGKSWGDPAYEPLNKLAESLGLHPEQGTRRHGHFNTSFTPSPSLAKSNSSQIPQIQGFDDKYVSTSTESSPPSNVSASSSKNIHRELFEAIENGHESHTISSGTATSPKNRNVDERRPAINNIAMSGGSSTVINNIYADYGNLWSGNSPSQFG
jgi:hypothetical protein